MSEPVAKKRRIQRTESGDVSTPGFAKWDLEQDYQQRMHKRKKDEKKRDKLLVKTVEGKIVDNPRGVEDAPDAVETDEDSESGADEQIDSGIEQVVVKAKPKKSLLPPKEQVRQAKEELARIASLMRESPDDHVGLLASLAEISNSETVAVRKLALATQLAVYKDIIPGYRIRPLAKDDLNAKVSKEVKKLRAFEQGLLSGYKDYVQTLSKLASRRGGQRGLDQAAIAGLASVAVSCACNLITNVPHFNCRNELIEILVLQISSRRVDSNFIKAREAFEKLFQEDEDGHSSLEAVSQITKVMKTKKYGVHESVLNTFLHLRLLSEFAHKGSTNSIDKDEDDEDNRSKKQSKQKREFRTKRERKVLRERKEVAKEMQEADAVVSYEDRDKNQSETLKLVFIAYFRILKERVPHLMGAVLEGLAKYSHLINQDFFGDILEALKDLITDAEALRDAAEEEEDIDEDENEREKEQRNATREHLLCIVTAFALLNGQQDVAKSANSLHLDLSFFITHLYRNLMPLSMDCDIELGAKVSHLADPNGLHVPSARDNRVNVVTTTVLLLRSLQSALLPPTGTKFVPPVRLAAFVKQLQGMALQLPQKSGLAVLEIVRQVTKTHGSKVAALWHTEERKGDGVFDASSQDVDSSNPFASTVWEGELLRLHFDPKIRESVTESRKNIMAART